MFHFRSCVLAGVFLSTIASAATASTVIAPIGVSGTPGDADLSRLIDGVGLTSLGAPQTLGGPVSFALPGGDPLPPGVNWDFSNSPIARLFFDFGAEATIDRVEVDLLSLQAPFYLAIGTAPILEFNDSVLNCLFGCFLPEEITAPGTLRLITDRFGPGLGSESLTANSLTLELLGVSLAEVTFFGTVDRPEPPPPSDPQPPVIDPGGNAGSPGAPGNPTLPDIAPIPLPAAGWMLLAALGALAAFRRRPA